MVWISAVTKLAPYVLQLGEIAVAAVPHITRGKVQAAKAEAKLTQDQIAELQTAATQNAEYIREIAGNLQNAITAIESRIRRLEFLVYGVAGVFIVVSAGILAVVLYRT